MSNYFHHTALMHLIIRSPRLPDPTLAPVVILRHNILATRAQSTLHVVRYSVVKS